VNDGKTPDPAKDHIAAVFYAFQKSETESIRKGAIVVGSEHLNNSRIRCIPFEDVSSELEALNLLVDIVTELDPDVVTGWEVQRGSWGYINSRAALYGSLFICILSSRRPMESGFEFLDLISRTPTRRTANDNDQWGSRHTSTVKIMGRHVLNTWRIMRSERNLASYTLENVAFHVLHRR
jgi:DNA polymerase zeta